MSESKSRVFHYRCKLHSIDYFNALYQYVFLCRLQILMVIGDLSTEDGCQNAVSKTIERFQRLDLLVANAGIFSIASVETIQMEEFDRVMNINVRSVVYLFNLCVPHLIATKGNIVTVSSIAGLRAVSQKT